MKVVSTEALTKLIQLVKSAFIKVEDTVQTNEITLATVATTGDYNDLTNKPTTRNVGEIIESVLPLTDAGLHLLDGSLILGGGIYDEFVQYVAGLVSTYPACFTTEEAWQQSVTDYGVCGKFVYNSVNNTVRLPKITGIVEGTTDLTALGDLIEAGLPNITTNDHAFAANSWLPYQGEKTRGPFFVKALQYYYNKSTNNSTTTSQDRFVNVDFDASRANPIYGNSTTVQPQTIKVLYYIVVATSVKTTIEVDIGNIATDLNGKADKDLGNMNASQTAKETIVGWGAPDWETEIEISSPFTVPADGFLRVFASAGQQERWKSSKDTLTTPAYTYGIGSQTNTISQQVWYKVAKGEVLTTTSKQGKSFYYKCKGVSNA